MDWAAATGWWVAAGLLVAVELATGTFYLLMLALGMAAGGLAAHGGLPLAAQFGFAALVGGGAVAAWRIKRKRGPAAAPPASNPDVNLDIGSRVHVAQWRADGTARVQYRGTAWDVRFLGSGVPSPGEHMMRALDGNCLLVDR
jgi:membrane protein implicated in regulation of membrane protease activity